MINTSCGLHDIKSYCYFRIKEQHPIIIMAAAAVTIADDYEGDCDFDDDFDDEDDIDCDAR